MMTALIWIQCCSYFYLPLAFCWKSGSLSKFCTILGTLNFLLIYIGHSMMEWVHQKPKAEQLLPKFYKLILGWVESIDAKGIHFSQSIWSLGCPMYAQFTTKNSFLVVLAVNWAYIGQPGDHMGWAKRMPFASIDATHPRIKRYIFGLYTTMYYWKK